MTSQINTSNIDILYPIAGQDNNSQGFRDNFSAIQEGLNTAASEITALQSHAIVSADANNVAVSNNFNGSTLSNGYYSQFNGVFYSSTVTTSAADIDLNNGPVQQFTLTQNTAFTFKHWPASGCGIVRAFFKSNLGGVFVPTFATANSGAIKYDINFPSSPVGNILVSQASSGTNVLTLSSATGLTVNTAVVLNKSIGGLVGGSVYYVKTINNLQITVSASTNAGIPGDAVVLTDETSIGGIILSLANIANPGFTVGGESLLSATVITPGTDYITPATITITGGDPVLQFVVPTLVATYKVISPTPSGGNAGNGYAVGDILVLNSNSAITFTVASITGGGSTGPIGSVNVRTNGGPLVLPISGVKNVTAVTGSGTGAQLTVKSGIFGITIINPGDGYNTVIPTITVTGSTSSSDATVKATLTAGTADNIKGIEAWSYDAGATVYIRYLGEF